MTVPCPRFSDLQYVYSSVCGGCTSSTLFRAVVFVCFWWYFVYTFQSCCICLFLMSILRLRFSELLYLFLMSITHPRFSDLQSAVASTRFRAAIFVLVCFWRIYLFHAFESCRISTPVCDVYVFQTCYICILFCLTVPVHSAVPLLPLCCAVCNAFVVVLVRNARHAMVAELTSRE